MKLEEKLATSLVALSQSGTGRLYDARPTLYKLALISFFVSSIPPEPMRISRSHQSSVSQGSVSEVLENLKLKESAVARHRGPLIKNDSDIEQQRQMYTEV